MSGDLSNAAHYAFSFRNTLDGPVRRGFGLAYIGWPGAAWAIAQALFVIACVALCLVSRGGVRRMAAVGLVIGSSIWALNSLYMSTHELIAFGPVAAVHAAGFVTVCIFAARCAHRSS